MFTKEEKKIITEAKNILAGKLNRNPVFTDPSAVKDFCQLRIGHLEHEVFGVIFLNQRHRMIKFVEMFRGTIDGASVYPREVAKQALLLNAAAAIFTHNHPSNVCEPSQADVQITRRLVEALRLLDVRTLDHIIVGLDNTVSFAERGLL